MTHGERDGVIEEVAAMVEKAEVRLQRKPWWSVWWTYYVEPLPHREEIAANIRSMKAIGK